MALMTCSCGCDQRVSVNRRFCKRIRQQLNETEVEHVRQLLAKVRHARFHGAEGEWTGLCVELDRLTDKLVAKYQGFPHGVVLQA